MVWDPAVDAVRAKHAIIAMLAVHLSILEYNLQESFDELLG